MKNNRHDFKVAISIVLAIVLAWLGLVLHEFDTEAVLYFISVTTPLGSKTSRSPMSATDALEKWEEAQASGFNVSCHDYLGMPVTYEQLVMLTELARKA